MQELFMQQASSIQGVTCYTPEDTTLLFSADCGGAQRATSFALKITNGGAIKPLIDLANSPVFQGKITFWPISGGRNFGYGTAQPVDNQSILLDLSALKNIDIDGRTQTVTIEPGVTQEELAAALDKYPTPFLVPVTGAGPHGSILGNALDGGYGLTPAMDHFDAVSVWEGVWGNGTPFNHTFSDIGCTSVARSWKPGVGPSYASLLRQGNFGIVTKGTVQLARKSESSRIVVFVWHSNTEFEESQEKLSHIMEEMPNISGIIMMNSFRILATKKNSILPYAPISDDERDEFLLAEAKRQRVATWSGLGTVFGSKGVVNATIRDLKRRLPFCQVLSFSPDRIQTLKTISSLLPSKFFAPIQDQIASLNDALSMLEGRPNSAFLQLAYALNKSTVATHHANPAKDGQGILWYAPLVPFNSASVRKFRVVMAVGLRSFGFDPLLALTTRSSRILSAPIPILFDKNNPEEVQRAKDCYKHLVEIGLRFGWPPYRIGVDYMHMLEVPEDSAALQTYQSLKQSLDPHNVISPGRYTLEIKRKRA